MKLNNANRAFVALLVISVCAYTAVGLAALGLMAAVGYQSLAGGPTTLRGHDLRAALVFLSLVGVGSLLGLRSFRRQWRATRELARRVRAIRVPTPPEVVLAASRTPVRRRVDVVAADEAFSFAYGLLIPRVVVSEGLLDTVNEAELQAVLEHELYHVRNLDPLKVLIARVLPAALFYLPVLRDLKSRYVAGREIAADRRALSQHGRVALAGALYKVVAGPDWSELGAAAAIGGTDLLDVRVTQLETGREPPMPGVSKLMAFASTIGIGVLVCSFAAALGDLGGPAGAVASHSLPWDGVQWWSGRPRMNAWGALVALARAGFWAWIGVLVYRGLRRRTGPRTASEA